MNSSRQVVHQINEVYSRAQNHRNRTRIKLEIREVKGYNTVQALNNSDSKISAKLSLETKEQRGISRFDIENKELRLEIREVSEDKFHVRIKEKRRVTD